jgi:hypothetical protein
MLYPDTDKLYLVSICLRYLLPKIAGAYLPVSAFRYRQICTCRFADVCPEPCCDLASPLRRAGPVLASWGTLPGECQSGSKSWLYISGPMTPIYSYFQVSCNTPRWLQRFCTYLDVPRWHEIGSTRSPDLCSLIWGSSGLHYTKWLHQPPDPVSPVGHGAVGGTRLVFSVMYNLCDCSSRVILVH